ncbi:hypothetical protein EW145_g1762 [Phellinidium pouzarii]|uniref:Thiamine phosphate synthase/TenI domain-containing protein n=1 Tax=Phellinidium pouzarii TaxID=167371 RepID=A0A4S4LDB2_9AGAM|nr:hypothetical protein EW145_g1762 [Phellinidium pouzarii]
MGFKGPVDYSLYLVTGRELLPSGAAIKGGVTIVQVREKTTDTGEFLKVARKTKEICHKYSIPVLINDRVDIALAMGADGVHVGQSDMPARVARQLLPPGSIVGVSTNTPVDVTAAIADGADYIGVGPIWNTQTKVNHKTLLGPRGAGVVLNALQGSSMRAVAIGGRGLDGVAVVSAIMASRQPREAARELSNIVRAYTSSSLPVFSGPSTASLKALGIIQAAAGLLAKIREAGPLIHQITNTVVVNQSANVTLALGASPIMATAASEMEDLSKVSGALLINFGTIGDKSGILEAGRWVNARRNPVIFDPVAVGATKYRFETSQELMNAWQASVIKGNPAEIGSGCIVGTSVAVFCAAANLVGENDAEQYLVKGDMFVGAISGILAITVASELAATREDVKGSGTFLPALIDEIYNLTPEKIIDRAQIELHP